MRGMANNHGIVSKARLQCTNELNRLYEDREWELGKVMEGYGRR